MTEKKWSISTFTDIGKRDSQEDRLLCETISLDVANGKGLLLAVLDGHCGDTVVNCVSSCLVKVFCESLMLCEGDIPAAMKRSFTLLEETCGQEICGTTVTMTYLPENNPATVFAGYMGDSPVFFNTEKNRFFLNQLHNVSTNRNDVSAIEAGNRHRLNNGELYINNRGIHYMSRYLQLTRAIGDRYFGDILIRTPEIVRQTISPSSPLVLASDGILVAGDSEKICQTIMQLVEKGADAEAIGRWVLDQEAHDNVSVIVAIPV